MASYKVAGIENRGSDDSPFGFIYLAWKGEIVGRIGFGSHNENPDPLAIWPCRDTPHDVNWKSVANVRDALASAFPNLAKIEA